MFDPIGETQSQWQRLRLVAVILGAVSALVLATMLYRFAEHDAALEGSPFWFPPSDLEVGIAMASIGGLALAIFLTGVSFADDWRRERKARNTSPGDNRT
jgi:hypothetical protein